MTPDDILTVAERYESSGSDGLRLTAKEVTLVVKALREYAGLRRRREASRAAALDASDGESVA
ncbi:MAG: hypothetical protein IT548_10775 [Alphaproteobacteria bacterium]|nr:hypothetical protein [Alphaproteobacteria bacterium]